MINLRFGYCSKLQTIFQVWYLAATDQCINVQQFLHVIKWQIISIIIIIICFSLL